MLLFSEPAGTFPVEKAAQRTRVLIILQESLQLFERYCTVRAVGSELRNRLESEEVKRCKFWTYLQCLVNDDIETELPD